MLYWFVTIKDQEEIDGRNTEPYNSTVYRSLGRGRCTNESQKGRLSTFLPKKDKQTTLFACLSTASLPRCTAQDGQNKSAWNCTFHYPVVITKFRSAPLGRVLLLSLAASLASQLWVPTRVLTNRFDTSNQTWRWWNLPTLSLLVVVMSGLKSIPFLNDSVRVEVVLSAIPSAVKRKQY